MSPDIVSRLEAADATRAPIPPGEVTVMLAGTAEKPFTKDGWVFEIKYDGYRLLAGKRAGTTFLTSRAGNDFTRTFPDVAKAIDKLPYDGFIVDGEVVVHDDSGIPDFQRLQKRGRLTKTLEIARAAGALPATLYVFDLLSFDDFDVRKLPLTKRKEVLRLLLPTVGPLRYSEHIAREGEAVFEQVNKLRLEGVVAKKADSPYRSGRSDDWLKIRAERTDDFVIVGFTEPKASRGGFGALHLAQYDGDLVYCGSVGTGFSAQQLDEIRELLDERLRDDAPCAGEIPHSDKHHWVDPDLVCEVRFREITEQGMLRHPSFLRFR
ncbi:MAG: non-homologous end-joining DNA ligase, partial [Gemmatimonadales bacterium]